MAESELVSEKTLGIDATTLAANAAMRSIGASRHRWRKTCVVAVPVHLSWICLRLPGRGEKIHERVCRYGDHVPIREVWHAGAMTGAVRRGPGLGGTPGTCASNASNETGRS